MWPRSQAALQHAIDQPFGTIVVVGPTGSGKTTTLYACLQVLNTPDRQLTTIEDPVEYRAVGMDQVEVNPRAGLTFAAGLRTILRSDPDVLLVGEIRDEETAQIAFRAAMTGHLVLTTLHAQTAAAAVQRLTRHEHRPGDPRDLDQLHRRPAARAAPVHVLRRAVHAGPGGAAGAAGAGGRTATWGSIAPSAAPSAASTGYRGRVALFEVLTMTDEIALLIGAPTREIEAMAIRQGMFTLRDDGVRLAVAGITTLAEVRRVAGVAN